MRKKYILLVSLLALTLTACGSGAGLSVGGGGGSGERSEEEGRSTLSSEFSFFLLDLSTFLHISIHCSLHDSL